MKPLDFLKKEFEGFTKTEKILFPLIIFAIVIISVYLKDSKIALISAVCGISYTILAGKGRVSCYFIGITGTVCYSYISFINGFYGQLALYALYYLPMEIIGIYKWSRHLKKNSREIIKTKLNNKERIIYSASAIILTVIMYSVLKYTGDSKPAMDSFAVVFSVLGQFLTVKRCIEQWYIWFMVNLVSLIMWIYAYTDGSNCFVTIIMWGIYVILAVYFLNQWKKDIKKSAEDYPAAE